MAVEIGSFVVLWLLAGLGGSGFFYAEMQRSYPELSDQDRRGDAGTALILCIFGPVGSIASYFASGFAKYGWLFPGLKP